MELKKVFSSKPNLILSIADHECYEKMITFYHLCNKASWYLLQVMCAWYNSVNSPDGGFDKRCCHFGN